MSWDFLNSESEEVKKAFSQISETEKALRKAIDNYRPSVMKERYLSGEEVCKYLHISPLSADETSSIPNPASAKHFSTICAMSRCRSNANRLFTIEDSV